MSWTDLQAKYGGRDKRQRLNKALRAEMPGGIQLLDAISEMQAYFQRPSGQRDARHDTSIRQALEQAMDAADGLRESVMAAYGIGTNDTPRPQGPGREESKAAVATVQSVPIHAPVGDSTGLPSVTSFQSTPAKPLPDGEPGLSLDLLRPSTRGDAHDNRTWTPPAVVVEQMGRISDIELSRITGVSAGTIRRERERLGIAAVESDKEAYRWTPAMDELLGTRADRELAKLWGMDAEAVRRRRIKLGIAAERKITRWTADHLALLDGEPDNAKVAAATGFSVAAVKTQRSRRRA